MPTTKRTKAEVERDLSFIARQYCLGLSLREISTKLCQEYYADRRDGSGRPFSLSLNQIHYEVQKLHKIWRDSAVIDFNEARAREVAKLDAIEAEALDAWRSSRGEMQESVTERRTGEKSFERAQIRRFREAGDPRFLQVVQQCCELRCKLLGLVTAKHEHKADSDTLAAMIAAVAKAEANGG